jgi:lipid II:glycine glycyltransferase (peptidoglycan interpeptide bridge formation enzyme)
MIQLAEPGPFFIIKDILYITMQTIKKSITSNNIPLLLCHPDLKFETSNTNQVDNKDVAVLPPRPLWDTPEVVSL